MRMLKPLGLLALSLLAVGSAPLARAQGAAPFYLGVNVGSANADRGGSALAFRLTGGYELGRIAGMLTPVALEAYYHSLGTFDGSRLNAYGLDFYAPLKVSMQTSVFGRVGLGRLDAEAGSADTGIKLGLGLDYELSRQASLRGEMEFNQFENDINVVSFGVVWHL